ncbi:MAG TPA: hypothetical protein VF579_06730 [Candidatus Methylomirabilis sp.]
MWMWHGSWGGPWGFGWLIPLFGLAVMILMLVVCMRRIDGMPHCGCMPGHGQPVTPEVEALRREVQALRDELRTLRERA